MGTMWHLTFEAKGRETFFRTEESLRAAVRALAAVAGEKTVLFCIVDDHVHLVVRCDRTAAGRLAQSISVSLQRLTDVGIKAGTYIGPVESRAHLFRLVGYLLTQPPHHGLSVHPALWTGSCFQDLVGARVVGILGQPLASFFPRFQLSSVMETVGLGSRLPAPADDGSVRAAGAVRLAAAACAALSVGPPLVGRSDLVVRARTACAVLTSRTGMATRETASALHLTMRATQRLALSAPDEQVLLAIRRRLALEDAVGLQGGTEREIRTGS